MKDYGFNIKISDLLLSPWKKDKIVFEKKFTSQLPWLGPEGISWEVHIEWLNEWEVKVELKNIKARIKDTCSRCGEEYRRDVHVKNFETKFVVPSRHHDITENIHDEEFLINTKNETIDIEDLVVQSIQLEAPLTPYCDTHKNVQVKDDDVAWSFWQSQSLGGTVIFKNMSKKGKK